MTERFAQCDSAFFYACAAKTGQERAVVADLKDVGAWAWMAEELLIKRFPGCSDPQMSSRPLWPGYVFANLTPMQFFEARNIKGLHHTRLNLAPQEVTALRRSIALVEAEKAEARRKFEAGDKAPTGYDSGQALEVLGGLFRDRLASFAKVVQRSGEYRLQIEVEGMALPVEVSPHDVRKAG